MGGGNYPGNITDNGAFAFASTTPHTLGGVFSGNGTLTYTGASTLTFTNPANTFSGTCTISSGTLALVGSNFGTAQISLAGGTTLQVKNDGAGTINLGNKIQITASLPTIDVSNNGGATTGSTVAFGQLAAPVAALATVTNFTSSSGYNASFTGYAMTGTTGQNCTLNPTTANAIVGDISNTMSGFATGNFDTCFLDGTSSGNQVTGIISDAIGGAFTPTTLGGYTRVFKTNTSTWTISGNASTYTGITQIQNGTLKAGAVNIIPAANQQGIQIVPTGAGVTATFDANGFNQTINGTTVNGALLLSGTTTTSAPVVTGVNSTLTLLGDVVYNAASSPLTGVISVSALDLSGTTRNFNVGRNFNNPFDLNVSSVIQNGTLSKTGTGVLNLLSANTYAGGTVATAGTIVMNNGGALGVSGGNLTVNGGTVDLNGFNQTVGALSGTSGQIVNNGNLNTILTAGQGNATSTFSAALSGISVGGGTLGLSKIGTGSLTLGGASSFTGPLTVTGGLVAFATAPISGGPLGNVTFVSLDGGGISATAPGFTALNRDIIINLNPGTVNVASSAGTLTVNSVTSGGGALIKNGSGILQIPGITTLNGGAASVNVSDGQLNAAFGANGISTLTVGATGNMNFNDGAIENLTLSATPGALTVSGGAQFGFELTNTSGVSDSIAVPGGGTAITAGTVTINIFGAIGFGTYTLLQRAQRIERRDLRPGNSAERFQLCALGDRHGGETANHAIHSDLLAGRGGFVMENTGRFADQLDPGQYWNVAFAAHAAICAHC